MDVFYKKVHQGCCEDALYDVGEHYKDKIVHNSSVLNLNVYYLVSFDNVLLSYGKLVNSYKNTKTLHLFEFEDF